MASLLILAQADDVSGELLAEAVERVLDFGAQNAQVLASVTKKGRPGHVLLVDAPRELEAAISDYLAVELGILGYHVLETRHVHAQIECRTRHVTIRAGGIDVASDLCCKVARRGSRIVHVKVEHDDLARLGRELAARGSTVPAALLRAGLEQAVWRDPDGVELMLEV